MRDRYAGFNDTHLTEKLREVDAAARSRASRSAACGTPSACPRSIGAGRPNTEPAGPGRQRPASCVQLDGSPFAWLEDRGPAMTLLGAIDDATSQVIALHFRPTEDLHGYATLLHQVCTTAGLPVALYGDGINILVRNDRHWSLGEQLAGRQSPTHVGCMLQDLGIGYMQARSPQAKGRIERLWAHAAGSPGERTAPAGHHHPRRRQRRVCRHSWPTSTGASPGRRPPRSRCGGAHRLISPSCSVAAISGWLRATTSCASAPA